MVVHDDDDDDDDDDSKTVNKNADPLDRSWD